MQDLKGDLASLSIERNEARRSPWRWPLLFFIPVILGLLALYGLRLRQAWSAVEVEVVRPAVAASGAAPSAGTPVLTASGYLVARRKAVVSAKIQGRLAELRVEEGSAVREGEIIARLESAEYAAAVAMSKAAVVRSQADLGEAQRQLRLAQDLERQQIVSRDQLDASLSKVSLAQAAVAEAHARVGYDEAQFANTNIRAPFSGVVLKKMAEVGESVAPIPPGVNISTSSGAIVALADLATLEVEADVNESNVAKLGDGQPAEVTAEAFPDRKYKAVLRQVIPTADRTKATVQVKVTILDKDKDLRPEMSARVTFLEPAKADAPGQAAASPAARILTIPKAAVVTKDGGSVVFEIREDKVYARRVTLGGERSGQVVVREGLAGGEALVSSPAATLKDGDRVKVKS